MKTLHTIYSTFAKHNMAKFLTILTILFTVGVGSMWGAEVTFTTAAYNGKGGTSGTGGSATSTSSGVTITSTKAYYTSAHIREYSGGTITVSSSNNITKIVFTSTASGTSNNGPSKISLNSGGGNYSYSGTEGTWTGSSTSIKFDCDAQFRWTEIVVTTKDADPYTVTFHTTATKEEDIKEVSAGAGVTPPTMEEECGEWEFQGWSESSSNSETSTTPLSLVTLTNGKYYPTKDIDLYPVYTKSEGGGGTVTWDKITTAPTDWSGEYLIVNSNYAMTSDFNSGTSGEFKGAQVTISNNQVTSSPTDKMIWIVEKNGSNAQYSFKNKSTGTYAKITGTSSTNAALSSSVIWFTISSSSTSGVWKINSVDYSARCFSYYSSNKTFRTYANSSNTTGSLYKKNGSSSTTYYYSYPQCVTETAVTLNPNGGKIDGSTNNKEIQTQNGTLTLPTPTRDGYNFAGWNTKIDGLGDDFSAGENKDWDAKNTELFAQWTPKALTNYRTDCDVVIKCDAYSFHTGDGTIATMEKEENIICFEEHGVAQGGLEHEWQINNYTIPADEKFFVGYYGYFYNDNLGIGDTEGDKSRSVVSDWTNMYLAPSMTSDDPEHSPRLGHAKGAVGTLRIFEDSDWDNLFVGFIPDGYIVKFGETKYPLTIANADNHEYRTELLQYVPNNYANAVSVGVIDENGNYVATANTQEMRHIFLKDNCGWSNDGAKLAIYYWGGLEGWCGFLKTVPGDATLFEGWIPSNATHLKFVRYNSSQSNPGSWDYTNDIWNVTGDLTIPSDNNLFTMTEFSNGTWSGYTKYGKFRMYEDSKAINWYLHFYPYHALTYDKNADDATGTMDMAFVEADASEDDRKVTTSACGFTRPGYRFDAWKKGQTNTNYKAGVKITLDDDVILYAIWKKEYTVTYDANGGNTTCVDNKGYITGETVTICNQAPTKTGYTFDGWLRSDNGAKVKEGESFTMPANDVTLTAQWIIDQYKVTLNPNYPTGKTGTFIDNNGNMVNQVQLTYNYNTPSMPLTDLYQIIELEGYQFNGWYSATSGGSEWTETGKITKNVTVYAQWTKVYSVILFENGTTTELEPQTSTSYTLPTELTAGSCQDDTKEFVGWSTVEIPTPGNEPTTDYYVKGAAITLSADKTTFYAVFATATGGGTENLEATLSFADKAQRTSYSTSKQVWEQNGIILTNEKGSSTSNVADYANPARFYKNSNITIEAPGNITQIEFNCVSGYVISVTGATTTSGTTVTVTLDGTSDTYTIESLSAQVRLNSVVVNYTTDSGTSYSDYTTTCVKLPDPVLSFATEPANPIVFTDAVCGGNSSKQSVTVVGENLRDVVNVSVTGPYKIARTASTALKDFTTSLTLDKTTAGAIHSNYQTVYIISTPPAQSTEATTGTLTFTTTKGNTLTVNLSTPTVTCTQYTLTLVDRGVSTEQPTKYYAGETIDEAPADPEGVCTDPIHYVFDGWAAATVAEGSTAYTKVTFPYTVTGNTKFYAVYRYVEEGSADSGDYVKVTEDLDDYSGDYLIVYEEGGLALNGDLEGDNLDASGNSISVTITNNTIVATDEINASNFTIAKESDKYSIRSASGYYIGQSTNANDLKTNSTEYYANTITLGDDDKVDIVSSGAYLRYNANSGSTNLRFRYYKSDSYTSQKAIALYRKAASYLYTTSPVCGPHLVITEGKEIYVTGGNAGGTRDLVIAQQKVSYKATRLKTSNGLADGTAPDVKVATNGITVGGVVTSDVKVAIDQTKELQADGTYTIAGTITVQYQPSANNKQEDIQVQLAVDYNSEARDNFTVHARSLPAEFVIVAKSGDKWYALNGDMNNGSSANPANGQITLNDDANPTQATYAPCNTIYTFDGLPNTGDRTRVRFQGTDGAWLWAASGTNVGIQNKSLKDTPEGDNKAYNWKLETEDNITYKFHNDNSSRLLGLSGEKFGMYASAVQELRILPYVEKCLYNYAPSNLIVKELKGSYVVLTWDAVVGATKYQYSTNATTWTDAGTEPTVTINGLTGDTEYIYYIRAYHEDAGVSQECIDYAEITFTTADCDDVPTNITYTADLNSITVSWTAAAPTATIKLFMNEDGTGGGGTYPGATSPYTISGGLDKNTTYYIQILSDATCASPIIPVKTEDVELDIVEWKTDGIVVDINTHETVGVTLENEVSYGTGLGTEATELFFSKYYEATGNVKLVAVYNGTKNIIDLTNYTIQYGKTSWESNYITLKDFGTIKGQIQPGEEIILYSMQEKNAEDDKEIMDCVHEQYPDGAWVKVTASNNEGGGNLQFGGDKTIILCETRYDETDGEYYDYILDVIGALTDDFLPDPSATEKPSWGDKEGWVCQTGLSIADDSQIGISTNRCLLIRNNTVTSGENAVASNINDFVTLCTEWKGAQVPDNDTDNGVAASCENFAYVGTFDYSDYYTKYVPMDGGTSTFDENDRNPDGTVSIYIPDLYKRACSNIRVKLTNSDGEVLTDREYKVPIMITTDQATAYTEANKDDNAFYALQENLATVEVDVNGNVINTYPLTLDEVREICKTCDVVIRDNATLTKALDDDTNDHPQVNNVMIYEGASLEIPSGADYNYTINSLSLRRKGDIVASAKVEEGGKLHLPASATAPIYLDMRIDANNWHWFTLPYDCNIADVTWVDGTPAQYNKDWFIMYYDGNSRANEQSIYENHWKVYNGTTIEAGKGYIVGIQGDITHPNYTFELRFPMTTEVLTNEHTDKTVAVNAWGVNMDITPNKKGWNLVGNPYLDYYKTSENISFKGLSLIKYEGIDPVTGDRLYNDSGTSPFLVTPVDGGWYEYRQELASDVEMMPFTAYFVQVGDPANASHTDGMELHAKFVPDNRGRMSLIRRVPQEVDGEQEPVIVRVEVANAKGESDKTTLIIDDRFTNEYEMNADFFKWFGDYYRRYTKPVLYSMGADAGKRAFNALSEQLAAQPIPLGMFAAQAGDYTFTLTRKRCDLSSVEEVWLYDATNGTYTNLMQSDYTFQTAKTEGEGRFYLSVKMRQNAPTDITDIYGGNVWANSKDGQIIVSGLTDNTQLWIYDATGKLLHTEQTTNFQHVYEVPVVGTYFVRTQLAGQAQTIKVLVE